MFYVQAATESDEVNASLDNVVDDDGDGEMSVDDENNGVNVLLASQIMAETRRERNLSRSVFSSL